MAELPPAAKSFDMARFLGTWHIVATNYGFWKRRIHPTVTYGRVAGETSLMTDVLSFEVRPMLGGPFQPATLEGVDRQDGEPGRFLWRGKGLLGLIRSPWCVVAVGDDYDWAVTYFGRSNVGTAPGVDLYAREKQLPPARVEEILAEVRATRFMAQASAGLFATVQKGVPAESYRLEPSGSPDVALGR